MTALLICAALVMALLGGNTLFYGIFLSEFQERTFGPIITVVGLALLAVALWLAYAAGGA